MDPWLALEVALVVLACVALGAYGLWVRERHPIDEGL